MADTFLDLMIRAALAAGETILEIYNSDFVTSRKEDGSPVTAADHKAEEIILHHLAETGLPVLAEESVAAGHIPELGSRFFAVDPLDGTKEFLKRNGEFTVNIALIENGRPTHGVVIAPALGEGYAGGPGGAIAFGVQAGQSGPPSPIRTLPDGPLNIVASRSHGHAKLDPLFAAIKPVSHLSIGSSLKFCLLACGSARLYPRFTPTSEWDTAAGQAILEAAGGAVLTADGSPLVYGKSKKDYINPWFVAASDQALAEMAATEMDRLIRKGS